MKLSAILVFTLFTVFARSSYAEQQRPRWITDEKLATLKTIGIDPTNDLEVKGNYHWRYRAKRSLVVGVYSCPIGSAVDLSRNIVLVLPPEVTPCTVPRGGEFRALKLAPNGSAEPLS